LPADGTPIPRKSSRDTNSKTAQLVELISQIGPDIPEISRRLGQYKESVRYRYKTKLLDRGFTVQATVDHEKLDLRRVLLIADFAPDFRDYAHSILTAMNELCYVVSFEKRLIMGDYLIEASVPAEFVKAFLSFVMRLQASGLFQSLAFVTFDWSKMAPMRPEYYDFDTGRWDFDWSTTPPIRRDASYRPSQKGQFDRHDLLVLKELQVDATRSFREIASKLKMNYKTLTYHYSEHVAKRKMIAGYHLRWMGTKYNSKLEKALHRQHRYLHVVILARGLGETQRMDLMAKAHSIPFVWSEMAGEKDYAAHFYFPQESMTESLQFLTGAIAPFKEKVTVMLGDQSEALSFTFSYQLYDQEAGQWSFNEPQLKARFGDLIEKIKEVGGT